MIVRVTKPTRNRKNPINAVIKSGGEPIALGLVQTSANVNDTRLSVNPLYYQK